MIAAKGRSSRVGHGYKRERHMTLGKGADEAPKIDRTTGSIFVLAGACQRQ
jgi:hypothetical protein